MWICTSSAFLSVVADREHEDRLLVRARIAGHIESVFPKAKVFTSDSADYMFRSFIPRDEVAQVIAQQVKDIHYDNFKNSVKNKPLHDAYLKIWTVMVSLQERFAPNLIPEFFDKYHPPMGIKKPIK